MTSKKLSVVDEAINRMGGSPIELARRLSEIAGEEITRQRVHGWRLRGVFPRQILVHVETLCKIPLGELIAAEPKDHDQGNIVNRAIRLLGADANAALLAEHLTKLSGRKITRQMVNGWQALEQFPINIVPFVHMLVGIPVKEMVSGRHATRAGKKRGKARSENRA